MLLSSSAAALSQPAAFQSVNPSPSSVPPLLPALCHVIWATCSACNSSRVDIGLSCLLDEFIISFVFIFMKHRPSLWIMWWSSLITFRRKLPTPPVLWLESFCGFTVRTSNRVKRFSRHDFFFFFLKESFHCDPLYCNKYSHFPPFLHRETFTTKQMYMKKNDKAGKPLGLLNLITPNGCEFTKLPQKFRFS